jgi:fructokinase
VSGKSRFFGAVEFGGSKVVCAIAEESGRLIAHERFPTVDPLATMATLLSFLRGRSADIGRMTAIGVGSFGPVELDKNSAHYGFIGRTPKPGWSGIDVAGPLAREFLCPIGLDTDVNAAALAEHRWGAATDVQNLVYVTVGTGIGGGVLIGGKPIHGLMHPEIGHMYPRRHPRDLEFAGICPFHGDCLEGLASGPAIVARAGAQLQLLGAGHAQWEIEADYLGQLCANLVVTLSPQRIVMGGGVMSQRQLLPAIRRRLKHWLRGYINRPQILSTVDRYVVAAGLDDRAGVLGALALAMNAAAAAGA